MASHVLDVLEKAYQERVPVLIGNPLMSEIKAAEKRRTPKYARRGGNEHLCSLMFAEIQQLPGSNLPERCMDK